MKGSLKNTNFIFRVMCSLLLLTSFTCIALARYISISQIPINAEIGSFHCSINVQINKNETMIPFFNSKYIINGNVMNTPQKVPFLVNNCDLKADGTYSKEYAKVDLKYDLIFYIPKEFATISAFQLSKIDEDTKIEVASTPLFILERFLDASATKVDVLGVFSEVKQDVETGKDVTVDYGSLDYTYSSNVEENKETFTRPLNGTQWVGDKNTVITIEEDMKDAVVNYTFPTFDQDTTNIDISQVTKYDPIYVTKNVKNLGYYKITISHPNFIVKGGKRHDCNHYLRITTTRDLGINENTCGSDCAMCKQSATGSCQDTIHGISFKEFYEKLSDEDKKSMEWDSRFFTSTDIAGTEDAEHFNFATIENHPNGLNGLVKYYEIESDATKTYKELELYVATFTQKTYPVRINAIFTQAKTPQTQT